MNDTTEVTADMMADELQKPENRDFLLKIVTALHEGESESVRLSYDQFFSLYAKMVVARKV